MGQTGWIIYFVALGFVIAFIMMRRSGQIPLKDAQKFVKQGALVVDVRSPNEFNAGHLSQAFNYPIDQIEMNLPNNVKDRKRIILVHCQSGLRSKKAKERLEKIGYENVFDMGSYERAFKIVSGRTM